MEGLIILILITLAVAIAVYFLKKRLGPFDESYRPEGPRGDDARLGRVAGITFHCTAADCGGFIGRLRWDDDNPLDCNAVAIEAYPDGRLLGFVPRVEARDWRRWAGAPAVPCIGYITRSDDNGKLYARFKAFTGGRDYVRREMESYAIWMCSNFGPGYEPAGFRDIVRL